MVMTCAAAEVDQLLLGVFGVLTGQTRVLRRNTCTIGTVAGGTSRNTLGRNTGTVNGLAELDGSRIFGVGRRFKFLLAKVGRNIANIGVSQRTRHDAHGWVWTRSFFAFSARFEI